MWGVPTRCKTNILTGEIRATDVASQKRVRHKSEDTRQKVSDAYEARLMPFRFARFSVAAVHTHPLASKHAPIRCSRVAKELRDGGHVAWNTLPTDFRMQRVIRL